MNIKTIKKAEPRLETRYLSRLNIKGYGDDNLYPQRVSDIIDASAVGGECLSRYARFIEGNGFTSTSFSERVVNRRGDTADDLLHLVCGDLARYNGFALHLNYNAFGQVAEVQHIPFDWCRLGEEDATGYIGEVVVHRDWAQRGTASGKRIPINTENVERFKVYNPNPQVLAAQVAASGGIEKFGGQIMYVSGDAPMRYPRAKYDGVITELSTDEGLSNVKFRNVRNNFLATALIFTRRGQSAPDGDFAASGFAQDLAKLQGDTRSNLIAEVPLDATEEKPELLEFPTKNFDAAFKVTDESVVERIYCAFEQEPFLCIRNGKIGFSGTLIRDAYEYYSSIVNREQRIIERTFQKVFNSWYDPTINPGGSYVIEPLKFVSTDE